MPAKSYYQEKHNFAKLLQHYASSQGNELAYTFLANGVDVSEQVTFAQLDKQVKVLAAFLQSHVLANERAILVYPSGIEYVRAYLACLYAGVTAVPSNPPANQRHLPRLVSIIQDAKPAIVLTDAKNLPRLNEMLVSVVKVCNLLVVSTDTLNEQDIDAWQQPDIAPDTLAMLQYTSGSTNNPKGVMVTHANLLHNQQMLSLSFRTDEHSIYCSWLPLFHDMGLIGHILQSLYLGVHCVFMSPVHFIHHPIYWLQNITRFRATVSGAPNFAYELCARKVTDKQKAQLDLSNWEMAYCGAEPIRVDTIDRFVNAFASCGFKRTSFNPCYGLAEGTLIVSGSPVKREPVVTTVSAQALQQQSVKLVEQQDKQAYPIVSCGTTLLDQKIVIVNPETLCVCASNEVGEIWVKGPSITMGYWQNKPVSDNTMRAYTQDTQQGPFLRTGDLGLLVNSELYVVGRMKDIIIIRGQNYYPHDIELVVEESHEALKPHCGVAAYIEAEGEERIILVNEVDARYSTNLEPEVVFAEILSAVGKACDLTVYDIALIKKGSLPKTTSGKVQRQLTKKLYLQKELTLVAPTWRQFLQQGLA